MSEHARLAPSASERWLRCAASVQMTEALEDHGSAAAEEGTRAHNAMEKALKNYIAFGDQSVDMDLCDDDEMFGHVTDVVAYVIDRYENFPGDDKFMLIEQRVDLHYMTGRDDLWGKADVIIGSDIWLTCLDLKYGAGVFVNADTSQNRIYLLGVMSKLMKESRGDTPWEKVEGMIMQPRYGDKDGNTNRGIEFTPNELLDWKDAVLIPAAELTDRPGAPVAGKIQCQWCKAKDTCEAVQQRVNDLCSVFEPVVEGVLPAIRDTDSLDIDQLIEVHDNIPFIEGYLKAVSAKIRTLLEARDERLVGKLKLIRSRKTNMWNKDDDEILEELTKGKGRISKNDITKNVLLTAPQALKLKSLKDPQKAKLQSFITKSQGSLSIVPDSDPRANEFPVLHFEVQDPIAPEGQSENFDFL